MINMTVCKYRWVTIINHRHIMKQPKLLQYKCTMELNVKEHQSTIDNCCRIYEKLNET